MRYPSSDQQRPDARDELQRELQAALAECARLREENSRLRAVLGLPPSVPLLPVVPPPSPPSRPGGARRRAVPGSLPAEPPTETQAAFPKVSPADWQVALFRSLFRGREDVFAVRWEGKGGVGVFARLP